MKVAALFSLCAAALVAADQRTAQIYIQPITSTPNTPQPLAEISYDALAPTTASVLSYEAPTIPEQSTLVRIGAYDPRAKAWLGGTTATAAANFEKGYAPHVVLTVDGKGDVLGAACKGVAIDAGVTRDFGPQAVVVVQAKGKQPELNKPVVLSPEGRKVVEEPPKTFLQKYWWLIGIVVLMTLTGGGGDK